MVKLLHVKQTAGFRLQCFGTVDVKLRYQEFLQSEPRTGNVFSTLFETGAQELSLTVLIFFQLSNMAGKEVI